MQSCRHVSCRSWWHSNIDINDDYAVWSTSVSSVDIKRIVEVACLERRLAV